MPPCTGSGLRPQAPELRHHLPAPHAVVRLVHRREVVAGVGQRGVGGPGGAGVSQPVPGGPQHAAALHVVDGVAGQRHRRADGAGDAPLGVVDLQGLCSTYRYVYIYNIYLSLHRCIYVYICICIYICLHICIYICLHICIYVYIYVYIYLFT